MRREASLAEWTSFGIGGPAEMLCLPRSLEELEAVVAWANQKNLPLIVLGAGSNVLISDEGLRGVVVVLRRGFDRLRSKGSGRSFVRLEAGAGLKISRLTAEAGAKGWVDLVFLTGVPGTVGGAVVTNAGTEQGSMGQVVRRIEMINGSGARRKVEAQDLRFEYRALSLPPGAVVVAVTLESRLVEPEAVAAQIKRALEQRRQRQPRGQLSAGSFFKNPAGDFAGRLIEAAGLKGAREGEALISPVHANFIVNLGRATAAEVLTLAERVRAEVADKFGVNLEPEVRFLGPGRERWPRLLR